jgi:preprotein translocase subunit SecF
MRWFESPTFDFVSKQRIASIVSITLVVISLVAIFGKGLNFGIDFRGGKEFVFEFQQPVDVIEVRSELATVLGSAPEVKRFGSASDILIRTDAEGEISDVQRLIFNTVSELYPDNPANIIKTDVVGPRFAEDLKMGALNSVLFAMAIIFLYILIRFKYWYFSAGAVAALFHDVIIVLGIYTIFADIAPFEMQIDQAMIAAFLTIVGYSLNDTVVVFDRIRENSIVFKTMPFSDMINKSLNDTLSRTVITSVTTLFVVTVLFIFGGEVLKGFSFALVIGVILGTYSSLFIASTIVVELQKRVIKAKS